MMVAIVVAAACTGEATAPPTTGPTTTTVPVVSTTAPAPRFPSTVREAWDLMAGDVSVLSPEQVRAAGLLIGGHRPGLPFPRLYLSGDGVMRAAVAEVLSLPSPWNAQILVGMTMGDTPAAPELARVRDEVLDQVFGPAASLAQDLMGALIGSEGTLTTNGPAYDLPEVVASVEGDLTERTFDGSVIVASETGEGSEYTVLAKQVGTDRWEVVDGTWLHLTGGPSYTEVERGPALTLEDLPSLPDEVVAVSEPAGIVLLTVDGTAAGHLPFFGWLPSRGGTDVVLEDPAGNLYGRDGRPTTGYALGGGVTIRRGSPGGVPWVMVFSDGRQMDLAGDWRIDATGPVVTPDWYEGGTVYDVAGGRAVDIPGGCWVADAGQADWVLACHHLDSSATIETREGNVLVGDDEWGRLFEASGWPWPLLEGQSVVGYWDGLVPAGDRWLGRWSGECETVDGFVLADGFLSPLGGPSWEEAPSASVGGWSTDGRAVFSLYGYSAGCEQQAEVPGVYIGEPGEAPALLWDSGGRSVAVSVWHR